MRRGLPLLVVVLVATALVAVDPDYLLRQIEKGNAGDRSNQEAQKTTLRLTHPGLDFYVDVKLREYPEGRWLAVADFAGEPDVGTGHARREALRGAELMGA